MRWKEWDAGTLHDAKHSASAAYISVAHLNKSPRIQEKPVTQATGYMAIYHSTLSHQKLLLRSKRMSRRRSVFADLSKRWMQDSKREYRAATRHMGTANG